MPLTPRLRAALAELKASPTGRMTGRGSNRKGCPADPVWVLGDGMGKHPSTRGLQGRAFRLQRKAGLTAHGPHRNRHSRLTHLAERGTKPYALQALARHASLKTTMAYYIHTDKLKLAREAVAEIDAMTTPPLRPLGNGVETNRKRPQLRVVAAP